MIVQWCYLCLNHLVFQGKKKQQLKKHSSADGLFTGTRCLFFTSDVKDYGVTHAKEDE